MVGLRAFALGLGLAVLPVLVAGPARAQSEAELERARAEFAEGVELMNQARWARAARRFRSVMRVRATAQVKYNLGVSLVRAGQTEEGLRLLRQVEDDPELDAESRREARAEIARSERRGGRGGGRGAEPTGGGDRASDPGGSSSEAPEGGEVPLEDDAAAGDDAPPTGQRPFQIDLHAGFSFWGFGFVAGARFGIPLAHEGLIEGMEDAIYLTIGADFYVVQETRGLGGWVYGPGLGVPVTLQWQFYLDSRWTVFAELGAQFFLHPRLFSSGNFLVYEPGYWVVAAVGASYRIADGFLLTARAGTPYLSIGLTIDL